MDILTDNRHHLNLPSDQISSSTSFSSKSVNGKGGSYLFFGHEILSALLYNVDPNNANGHSLFSLNATSFIHMGGSTDVNLEDSIKSPDFSLYEDHTTKKPMTQGWPTVLWALAYSEDEMKLAHDLGRYIACSLGRVRLVIGLNVERNAAVAGQH